MALGLSFDAAQYLGDKRVVAVADGQLAGKAGPPAGTPSWMALPIHHYFLT